MGSQHLARIAAGGFGWHEAPRGSLGHWVEIEGKAIKNYQAVVPTTWNAGPRDAQGQRGPYEASLIRTPIADPDPPAGDSAHHSFLRPVHRLRGARDGCPRAATTRFSKDRPGAVPCRGLERNEKCPLQRSHPGEFGPVAPVYVWQYPLRLVHWGMVISIGVLAVTGYYIHDPYIIGQSNQPFLMGWFRFVHEAFGMAFLALFLLRVYLFFGGNKWVGWRQYIPLSKGRFQGNAGR